MFLCDWTWCYLFNHLDLAQCRHCRLGMHLAQRVVAPDTSIHLPQSNGRSRHCWNEDDVHYGFAKLLVQALNTKGVGLDIVPERWKAYRALSEVSWQEGVFLLQLVQSDRILYNELAGRCYALAAKWQGAVSLLAEARVVRWHAKSDSFFQAGRICVRKGHWEHTILA